MAVSRPSQQGFTLVELIVVITIIGLVAATVVLSLPDAGGGLRVEAERFAARAKSAQEDAVINSRATSVSVGPAAYVLARSEEGGWREIARIEWERGTRPEIGASGLRTRFDPTGGADPMELTLRRDAQRVQVVIGSDGEIRIRR